MASSVKFIMGGNQGHDHSRFTSFPLEILREDFDGYKNSSPIAYERREETVVGNDVELFFYSHKMELPSIFQ
jgi:hypothetical protein